MQPARSIAGVTAAIVGIMAGQLAASPPAQACSCALPEQPGLTPEPGTVDVPLNTRVYVPDLVPAGVSWELVNMDTGATTPLVESTLQSREIAATLRILSAPEPLLPVNDYEVRFIDDQRPPAVLTAFTTALLPDTEAPSIPGFVVDQTWSIYEVPGGTCGQEFHGASISVSAPEDAFLTLVAFDGPAEFDADRIDGELLRVQAAEDAMVAIGRGTCSYGWPEAQGGAEMAFQVGALDEAGNFSGWSERATIVLPETTTNLSPYCSHTTSSCAQNTAVSRVGLCFIVVVTLLAVRRGGRKRGRALSAA